ncbi:MAG: hypothetical protein KME29_09090 [Calothrix sp. FI2-JRJ7]|nr:hypothetical protein [Calothrix sp. FI2-JRJ7]
MIRRRFIVRFVITLLILGILSVIYIILMPLHDIDCNAEPFMSSKVEKFQVSATKVVAQPWLGQHMVYGIFTVPDEYKETQFFILTVKGAGSFCEKPFGNKLKVDDIIAQPGTHLIKGYIRTRLALKSILQGLYSSISSKDNWTLTYPSKKVIITTST